VPIRRSGLLLSQKRQSETLRLLTRAALHSLGHSRPAVSRPHMTVGQDSFVGG
jgi:hypothetical protein